MYNLCGFLILFISYQIPLIPHRQCVSTQVPVILLTLDSCIKTKPRSSNWCGSVGWVLSCKLKGRQFNSQSGHMPGLQTKSQLMFLSLSFSLSSPRSKNKYIKSFKKTSKQNTWSLQGCFCFTWHLFTHRKVKVFAYVYSCFFSFVN